MKTVVNTNALINILVEGIDMLSEQKVKDAVKEIAFKQAFQQAAEGNTSGVLFFTFDSQRYIGSWMLSK